MKLVISLWVHVGVGLTNSYMFFSYCGTLLKSISLVLLFFSMVIIANTIEYQYIWKAAAAAKSLQSCPTLCDLIDGSPPGSPDRGILQARTLEWVAISFSNAWKWKVKVKSLVMSDSSRPHGLQPTRLLMHGIFQARVLEWGAIAFSIQLPTTP